MVLRLPLFLLVLAFLPGSSASAAESVLTADVGRDDAYVIGLADPMGNAVTHLDPGTYTLVVHDRSAIHNFDLSGPGVSVQTGVDAIGDFTVAIKLTPGKYNYVCDPHATVMHGSFTVGEPGGETQSAPPPALAAPRLDAAVSSTKISLNGVYPKNGGKTTIVVRDSSDRENFHLIGPGVDRKTGVAFTGTVTWTVMLRTGTYVFRSDRSPGLHGSVRIQTKP